jgi:GcrA cell cycle regulator
MGWTEEEVAQLRDLTEQGLAASAIGRRMGKTRNAIIGKWGRMGDRAPRRRPHGPPVWISEKVDKLRKLWIGGYEVRQIADRLGMSVAAVYGKIRQVRPKHENAFPLREMHKKPTPKHLPYTAKPFSGNTVSFREHLDSQCRYIVGNPAGADTLYCADERLDGVSYCAVHARQCTTLKVSHPRVPFIVIHTNARLELAPE